MENKPDVEWRLEIEEFSFAGRDLVIGCYKYTNIPNSTWGVAIGKKRAETTILRHSMPK